MPVRPRFGDLVESRIVCYTDTQISINTIHWGVFDYTGDGATLEEIAQGVNDPIVSAYKALMSNQAKWRGVGARCLGPVTPKSIEYPYIANDGAGTLVSDLLPGQCTYVISKKTTNAGPENRGRIYPGFPPIVAADADGLMTTSFQATVAALAGVLNSMLVLIVTGTGGTTSMKAVVKHKGSLLSATPIDVWIPGTKFATQRRRGQLGRENVLPF